MHGICSCITPKSYLSDNRSQNAILYSGSPCLPWWTLFFYVRFFSLLTLSAMRVSWRIDKSRQVNRLLLKVFTCKICRSRAEVGRTTNSSPLNENFEDGCLGLSWVNCECSLIVRPKLVLRNEFYPMASVKISGERGCWELHDLQHPMTFILMGHGINERTHTHWKIT